MSIADCIRNFVAENEQYELYENYSGRGMFGKTCLGVVTREGDSYMNFLMKLTQYLFRQGIDDEELSLEGTSVDSLGLDTVVYFPHIRG